MAEISYGISTKNRRWDSLIHLTKLLYEGKVELEELVSQTKTPDALDHGFLKKRKRSPRNNNISIKPRPPVRFDPYARVDHPEKKPRSKVILENQYQNKPIHERSPKSTLGKNPIFEKPFKNKHILHDISDFRNPSLPYKREKFFEVGESSSSIHDMPETKRKSTLERNPSAEERKKSRSRQRQARQRLLMNRHIINNINNNNNNNPNLQLPLPEALKSRIVEIGGCLESVAFIIEKSLYPTDVSPFHSRLSVPVRQVRERFLLGEEVELLASDGQIPTVLIQPSLEECGITFSLWKSNTTYVLMKGWNNVWLRNGMTEGTFIRLWAFRRNSSELCFALEKVR